MDSIQINQLNQQVMTASPEEVIRFGLQQGQSIVSSHFGPYEAVLLHMISQIDPNVTVVWVDNGYGTEDNYRVAHQLIKQLALKVEIFTPTRTAAYLNVHFDGIPELDTPQHDQFTHILKLEPFQRALTTLKPAVWFTSLRKEQSNLRQNLSTISLAGKNLLKICPLLNWTTREMVQYLKRFNLPNTLNYIDPTKGLAGRECGLHKVQF